MVCSYTFFTGAKKWKAFLSLIIISGNLCLAQENIRFERISVNEGLSQSDIKSIVQDNFGFLWIGTRDGLNRYDGTEFRKYSRQKNDSTSLLFNQILDLAVDASGNVWIGSAGGISMYDYRKDHFQNFFFTEKALQDAEVNHILLTGRYAALLSTSKGLISFDLKQKRFLTGHDLLPLKGRRVFHAFQSPEHGLWVATDQGVFVRPSAHSGWTRLLDNNNVQHIHFDDNGKVYLSASRGLFSYHLKEKKMEQVALPPGIASVTEVMRTKDRDLWIAGNKVIVLDQYDEVRYVLEHDKFNNQSLSEDRARVLYQTRDGVIWVGTFGYGLNKFNPDIARFSYLSERTVVPLSGNYVSAIFTADDTTLLVGTSRGLDAIDLRTRFAKHFSDAKDLFQILSIIADPKGNIWVATSDGIMLYAGTRLITKNASLRFVYDMAAWDDTNLILTSRVQGVYLFNTITGNTSMFIPPGDLPEEVSCVLVEGDDLWLGCKDGLRLYNRKGQLIKHFTANHSPDSLPDSFIKCLYRDSDNNLWIGMWGGGLSKFHSKDSTFTTYDVSNGLPNNVVYGILEDAPGTLWLSTNLGISAFHVKDGEFRNFNFSDGLQSNEFNTGAYFRSAGGKLYFGGVNGLSFFYPDELLQHEPVPSILTTMITVNNQALSFGDGDSLQNPLMIGKLSTNWKANDIGIKFAAVDFKYGQTRDFQYSIKDTTWYHIGNRRSLELIDLPSGHHEIRVRTRLPGDRWSREAVLLTVDIVPPLWETAWFRIIAVLVFFALIYGAFRYRITRLRQANAALNRLVRERTQEIETKNEEIASQNDQLHEMNKELEAFSYSVSHDLRAPLRSVIGYSQMLEEDFNEKLGDDGRHVLHIVQQNAVRMNNLINDLLQFSKFNRKELERSEIDTEKLLGNVLNEINTSTKHKAEIRLSALPSVYADSKLLSQVWINLISNAIKYSAKKEKPVVEIGSYSKDNETVFYVKDNGAGFDMKYVGKLFGVFQRLHKTEDFEGTGVGLALVQRIVTRHGGRVWAEAKVNEGAVFYFSIPGG